jgi:hypothetical protein
MVRPNVQKVAVHGPPAGELKLSTGQMDVFGATHTKIDHGLGSCVNLFSQVVRTSGVASSQAPVDFVARGGPVCALPLFVVDVCAALCLRSSRSPSTRYRQCTPILSENLLL